MNFGRFTERFFKSVRADNGKEKGDTPESGRQKAKSKMNVAHFHSKSNVIPDNAVGKWLADNINSSKRLPVNQLNSVVVDVTPALAREILTKCNRDNRGLRKARVNLYAKAMAEGRWKLTSQGISLSRDGYLNNGQHRLEAIIASGETVTMLITFGEEREVFDIIDTSASRGPSDILKIAGFKNTAKLAASIRIIMMIESGNAGANITYSNDQVLEWALAHNIIDEYGAIITSMTAKLRTSAAGIGAAIYLIRTQTSSPSLVEQFEEALMQGTNLRSRSPILVLRENLKDRTFMKAVHPGLASTLVCAATIKAWNLWIVNKSCTLPNLMWNFGENFPVVR